MNKYKGIKSIKDLDNHILRLEIKKKVIAEQLGNNTSEFRESITIPGLLAGYLGINTSQSFRGRINTVVRATIIAFSTFKGGKQLLKKIKSIF